MVHSKGNILPDMVSKSLRDAVFEIVLALFATKLRKILLPRLIMIRIDSRKKILNVGIFMKFQVLMLQKFR
jgi:hypothetical protein